MLKGLITQSAFQ
jgi:hypothetical protein